MRSCARSGVHSSAAAAAARASPVRDIETFMYGSPESREKRSLSDAGSRLRGSTIRDPGFRISDQGSGIQPVCADFIDERGADLLRLARPDPVDPAQFIDRRWFQPCQFAERGVVKD